MKNKYDIIGLMSGTSLDGLDIAHCSFNLIENKWDYTINVARTIKYSQDWLKRLRNLETQSALEFVKTDMDFGHFLGQHCLDFIQEHHIKADFISSHGHTIFHQPELGLTSQIGSGACISATSRLPVVCDFRSLDVALKGQGAPLVPIGDKLLFSEYTYRLNLGGFANISFQQAEKTVAFDICPVNMAFNYLANSLGKEFDESGNIARSGNLNEELLKELNALNYYTLQYPKSLGKEWFLSQFQPILDKYSISINDKLRTVVEHTAIQISNYLSASGTLLITGGGAYHIFFIERLKNHSNCEIIIPGNYIIEYKEALIFGFIGLLRWLEQVNCLKSVTGATADSTTGAIYKPFN